MGMALSDIAIRNAKPGMHPEKPELNGRPYKLFDGGGLHLVIMPTGGKLWRLKYRVAGKEKLLSLGAYPALSLAAARKAAGKAREALAGGSDPALEKRRAKAKAKAGAGDTFAAIAKEYIAKKKREGAAAATLLKLEYHVANLTDIGTIPVGQLTATDILVPLRKVERRGNLHAAGRALQFTGQVLRYAVATARLSSDPSRDLRGALEAPKVKHRAAITDPVKLGGLLRAIDGYEGKGSLTGMAMQLAAYLAQRPGEIRQMRWEELDLSGAVWNIPATRTKMRKVHAVPLSGQVLAILTALQGLTGGGEGYRGYVFPSVRSRARPMSENTLNAALRRLGYSKEEATTHGWRATAKTLLLESGKWSRDIIDRWQSRGPNDALGSAYDRTEYWAERVAMAQWWSDYLDMLRKGADIVPIKTRGAGK